MRTIHTYFEYAQSTSDFYEHYILAFAYIKGKFRLNMIIYDIFTPYLVHISLHAMPLKKVYVALLLPFSYRVSLVLVYVAFVVFRMEGIFSNNISHFYLTPLKIHVIAIKVKRRSCTKRRRRNFRDGFRLY